MEIEQLGASGPRKVRSSCRRLLRCAPALTPLRAAQVTWLYWQLTERRAGVYKFTPVMDGDKQRKVEHTYIDPTGIKPSEMLMVWGHTAEERAAQFVDGVYTLHDEQRQDLHDWCARRPSKR